MSTQDNLKHFIYADNKDNIAVPQTLKTGDFSQNSKYDNARVKTILSKLNVEVIFSV